MVHSQYMENKTFSIREIMSESWDIFKKHAWKLVGITFAAWAVNAFVHVIAGLVPSFIALIASLLSIVVTIIISMGTKRIALKVVRGGTPEFSDFKVSSGSFWKYVGVSILFGLVILGGVFLLVIPGIIWGLTYFFSTYIVVDKNIGVGAFKESKRITDGIKWKLLVFLIFLIFFNMLGVVALLVGVLITAPMSMIATALIYTKFSGNASEPETIEPIDDSEVPMEDVEPQIPVLV